MKKTEKTRSPAYTLLSHVWESTNKATPHSWERLNHAMREALTLAIGAGMIFEDRDWHAFNDDFRGSIWGANSDGWEWAYRLAVVVGNTSAIATYEVHQGRGPFIADSVDIGDRYSHEGFLHLCGDRKRERLALGFSFPWRGEVVTVTSMPSGDAPLVACSYKSGGVDEYPRKILHRYKITAADIHAERAARKAAQKQGGSNRGR